MQRVCAQAAARQAQVAESQRAELDQLTQAREQLRAEREACDRQKVGHSLLTPFARKSGRCTQEEECFKVFITPILQHSSCCACSARGGPRAAISFLTLFLLRVTLSLPSCTRARCPSPGRSPASRGRLGEGLSFLSTVRADGRAIPCSWAPAQHRPLIWHVQRVEAHEQALREFATKEVARVSYRVQRAHRFTTFAAGRLPSGRGCPGEPRTGPTSQI